MFCYDHLIGEEYEKKRESVMKYTGNDVVRTTKIMDLQTEKQVLWMYTCYINTALVDSQCVAGAGSLNPKSESLAFYEELWTEVYSDFEEVGNECEEDDVTQQRNEDGTWETTEIVWVTKDGSVPVPVPVTADFKKVDPYISAHNARLASARIDILPPPEIMVPDDADSLPSVPTWGFAPLHQQADIAAPDIMCMIFQGKLAAVYDGSEENSDLKNGNSENVD